MFTRSSIRTPMDTGVSFAEASYMLIFPDGLTSDCTSARMNIRQFGMCIESMCGASCQHAAPQCTNIRDISVIISYTTGDTHYLFNGDGVCETTGMVTIDCSHLSIIAPIAVYSTVLDAKIDLTAVNSIVVGGDLVKICNQVLYDPNTGLMFILRLGDSTYNNYKKYQPTSAVEFVALKYLDSIADEMVRHCAY